MFSKIIARHLEPTFKTRSRRILEILMHIFLHYNCASCSNNIVKCNTNKLIISYQVPLIQKR